MGNLKIQILEHLYYAYGFVDQLGAAVDEWSERAIQIRSLQAHLGCTNSNQLSLTGYLSEGSEL
jgi:hypothetical protein